MVEETKSRAQSAGFQNMEVPSPAGEVMIPSRHHRLPWLVVFCWDDVG